MKSKLENINKNVVDYIANITSQYLPKLEAEKITKDLLCLIQNNSHDEAIFDDLNNIFESQKSSNLWQINSDWFVADNMNPFTFIISHVLNACICARLKGEEYNDLSSLLNSKLLRFVTEESFLNRAIINYNSDNDTNGEILNFIKNEYANKLKFTEIDRQNAIEAIESNKFEILEYIISNKNLTNEAIIDFINEGQEANNLSPIVYALEKIKSKSSNQLDDNLLIFKIIDLLLNYTRNIDHIDLNRYFKTWSKNNENSEHNLNKLIEIFFSHNLQQDYEEAFEYDVSVNELPEKLENVIIKNILNQETIVLPAIVFNFISQLSYYNEDISYQKIISSVTDGITNIVNLMANNIDRNAQIDHCRISSLKLLLSQVVHKSSLDISKYKPLITEVQDLLKVFSTIDSIKSRDLISPSSSEALNLVQNIINNDLSNEFCALLHVTEANYQSDIAKLFETDLIGNNDD